jgi:hypothetical protein
MSFHAFFFSFCSLFTTLIYPLPSILLLSHLLHIIIFDHSSTFSSLFCFLFLPPAVSFLFSLCFLSAQKAFSPSLLLILLFSLSFSPPQKAFSPLYLSLLSFPAYHCFSTLTHCCLFTSYCFLSHPVIIYLLPSSSSTSLKRLYLPPSLSSVCLFSLPLSIILLFRNC